MRRILFKDYSLILTNIECLQSLFHISHVENQLIQGGLYAAHHRDYELKKSNKPIKQETVFMSFQNLVKAHQTSK